MTGTRMVGIGMAVVMLAGVGMAVGHSLGQAATPDTEDAVVETSCKERSAARKQKRKTRRCFMFSCLDEIRSCTSNDECSAWMECLETCGDDQMLCPTVCGAFYQAPEINAFTQCALDNGCIDIDFSSLPACDRPDVPLQPVGDIYGFWWVSAIHGHDYVLYDDCQRFVLTQTDDSSIDVWNSTQVSYQGETRVVDNMGAYTRMPDGTLQLAYNNWVGYLEQYNPVYVTEAAMVMHVCSQNMTDEAHDYGALVLTRQPLDALDGADRAQLEEAVQRIYGLPLADFRQIGTHECSNGPASVPVDGGEGE